MKIINLFLPVVDHFTKITLETGRQIKAPLFINEGEMIKVNTETGEYVERVN